MNAVRPVSLSALPVYASPLRYLYLIGEEGSPGLFKIGRADHPVWRMSSLQSGNSRRLFLAAAWVGERPAIVAMEAELHRLFAAQRVAFEWFRLDPEEVAAFIEERFR